MTIGTKAQVLHGTADKTSGGLEKKHLKKTTDGRIVSKKQSKGMHPKMKAWGDATKVVMDGRKSTKFASIKKGTALYKKINKEYKALLKKRDL
jgi:hypothetical protein